MLGDIVYETELGKLIGTRLVSVEGEYLKSRVTISKEGILNIYKKKVLLNH